MKKRFPLCAFMAATLLCLLLIAAPLLAAAAAEPEKKIPVTVIADKLDYDHTTDVYTASGHVKIEQQGIRLEADRVVLNNKTGEAAAEGHVYLQDKSDTVRAERLTTNLNTRQGIIYKGALYMKKDNYYLKGDVIERKSDTVYHVENGEFTTCDDNDWFLRAGEMNIDMDRYATGNHVSLNMGGVPVLYTPYLLFPVRRQSGFLLPILSYSHKDGISAENFYFWAISDSKDMTIMSDYREKTGHGTGIEYRYNNSRESRGELFTEYWDIYHSGTARWEFDFRHQEEFAEDLSAKVDIKLVSDEKYYYDLNKQLEMRSLPYVDSNAFYVERWNTASLYLLGQYTIDLTNPNGNGATIQKLPELRYTIYEENLAGPMHINFEGSATNFYKKDGDGTRRVDFNPELTAALGAGGLSLTPRAGARATFYDRSATGVEPTERKYTYAGADLNARISKVYGSDKEAGIGLIRHSIEPTVSYTYTPHIDQGNIPQFDAVDNIIARNMTTYSIINRLSARYRESKDSNLTTSFDLLVLKLSQNYDWNAARDQASGAHTRSDITADLAIRTPKSFSLTGSTSYSTYTNMITARTVGATYTGDALSMDLSDNYTQNPASHYIITGGSAKFKRWSISGRWWRDVENSKTTEQDYTIRYASQCWGVTVLYSEKPGDYRFTALFDLKGLGSKGKSR
ncbi:MAG TPA: LPS assembly protein LptD [Nitrospirota bacterium]|nr:LPS assembly protein LptD [Nitrospirota bacterium]